MSWSLEFDEPIALPKVKALRTLRDAGEHVAAFVGAYAMRAQS